MVCMVWYGMHPPAQVRWGQDATSSKKGVQAASGGRWGAKGGGSRTHGVACSKVPGDKSVAGANHEMVLNVCRCFH